MCDLIHYFLGNVAKVLRWNQGWPPKAKASKARVLDL